MKVLVGLGNPGKKYDKTPHNIGFDVVDGLSKMLSCPLKRSIWFSAVTGKAVIGGEEILLIKPQTYMNDSGRAVASIMRYNKAAPADLVVVLDDADLDLGRLRIRAKGSSGGHRGLDSIIRDVGTGDFPRVRIGIGRDERGHGLVEHVLTRFSEAEAAIAGQMVQRAVDAVCAIVESGVESAMNSFNAKIFGDVEKNTE